MSATNLPAFDGHVLADDAYKLYERGMFNDTPILIGLNEDEGELVVKPPEGGDFEEVMRTRWGAHADAMLPAWPRFVPDDPEVLEIAPTQTSPYPDLPKLHALDGNYADRRADADRRQQSAAAEFTFKDE